MEEDEEEPTPKHGKTGHQGRVTTHRADAEIAIQRQPTVRSLAPCLPGEFLKQELTDVRHQSLRLL